MIELKYEVEVNEENRDLSVLKTIGGEQTCTIGDIKRHIPQVEKVIKENEAQLTLEEAKMTNIKRNYPVIETLEEEALHAVHMYYEAKRVASVCAETVKNHKQSLEDYEELQEKVKEATGFDMKI